MKFRKGAPLSEELVAELVGDEIPAAKSGKKVMWRCSSGHTWLATPINRTNRGSGCPTCYYGTIGGNLATRAAAQNPLSPELQSELVSKEPLSAYSNKKVLWSCGRCSHEWVAVVASRSAGNGCPECGKEKSRMSSSARNIDSNPLPEYLAQELVLPMRFSAQSGLKVEWRCSQCSFRWHARVSCRVRGTGCPKCSASGPSKGEVELQDFVESLGYEIVRNDRSRIYNLRPMELDVYIPEINKAIEYNGLYWHSSEGSSRRDLIKRQLCAEAGIDLLVVWDYEWALPDTKRAVEEWLLSGEPKPFIRPPVPAKRLSLPEVGSEFGDWRILGWSKSDQTAGRHVALLVCVCGAERKSRSNDLKRLANARCCHRRGVTDE